MRITRIIALASIAALWPLAVPAAHGEEPFTLPDDKTLSATIEAVYQAAEQPDPAQEVAGPNYQIEHAETYDAALFGQLFWTDMVTAPGGRSLVFHHGSQDAGTGIVHRFEALWSAEQEALLDTVEGAKYQSWTIQQVLDEALPDLPPLADVVAITRYDVHLAFGLYQRSYRAAFLWLRPDPADPAGTARYVVADYVSEGVARVAEVVAAGEPLDQALTGGLVDLIDLAAPDPSVRCVAETRTLQRDLFETEITTEGMASGWQGLHGIYDVKVRCTEACQGWVTPKVAATGVEGFAVEGTIKGCCRRSYATAYHASPGNGSDGHQNAFQGRRTVGAGWRTCLTSWFCGVSISVSAGHVSAGFDVQYDKSGTLVMEIPFTETPCRRAYRIGASAGGLAEGETVTVVASAGGKSDQLVLAADGEEVFSDAIFPGGANFQVEVTDHPELTSCRPQPRGGMLHDADATVSVVCQDCSELYACDDLPNLDQRCELAPELCGIEQGPFSCTLSVTGTWTEIFDREHDGSRLIVSIDRATLHCVATGGNGSSRAAPPTKTGAPVSGGDGPILHLATELAEVSGTAEIVGVARDDQYGVTKVLYWLDGRPITLAGAHINLPDPYTCGELPSPGCDANSQFRGVLDVSALADGAHTLTIVAVNGRPGAPIPTYLEHTFTVQNETPCPDVVKPTVALTAPAPGAVVRGTVTLAADAADQGGSGLQRLDFFVDGVKVGAAFTAPYTVDWDTVGTADGVSSLTAIARDHCGNQRTAVHRTVTVNNGLGPVTVRFTPSEDAFVRQQAPNLHHGQHSYLRVRTIDGGDAHHAYLRFAVEGLQGTVTSAHLRLRTRGRAIDALGVYHVADWPWDEDQIDWHNASLNAYLLREQQGLEPYSWYQLDVTPALTADGTVTLGLATPLDLDDLDLWSAESSFTPELVVTYTPVP